MNRLTATVVIPTWRRPAWLRRCLDHLAAQTQRPDEVIVVGRPDDTETRSVLDKPPAGLVKPTWAEVERPGHVAPVRKGLAAASGQVVAFLDDDCEAAPAWLEELLVPFADPRVACVGGKVITPGYAGSAPPDAGNIRWYGRHVANLGSRPGAGVVDVDGVMEGNWAWRAGVLRGLDFDPRLDFEEASMYGLDLCLQAIERGHRVLYQPRAEAVHRTAPRDPELDRANRPRRALSYSRNYTYIALKHLHGWRRAAFLAWWWLVGERGSYGVATAAVDLVRGGGRGLPVMRAAFAGKREGVLAWRSR